MPETSRSSPLPEPCSHRAAGRQCPISKTPCMGECVYADILEDISLGIIGLDLERRQVFFQNKLAVEIFRGTIRPKDYRAIAALLLADAGETIPGAEATASRRLRYGNRFLGFTIYRISETLLWIYVSDITEKTRLAWGLEQLKDAHARLHLELHAAQAILGMCQALQGP